jgi:molecular chaperone DnaK
LTEYFEKQGYRIVLNSLWKVVGKAVSFVAEDDHYWQYVVQPAWEAVPLPVRALMGRRFDRWKDLYRAFRTEVFDLTKRTVDLRPRAEARIPELLKRFCTAVESAPASTNGASAHVPVAPLVPPSARKANVPLAQPVGASAHNANGQLAAKDVVVGIDLGTTYSLIAHIDAQGRPCCIPNSAGDLLTPSVVLFDDDGTVVGKEAIQASVMEPERVAECIKRDMGAKFYRKKINGEHMPPEVISSIILRSLKSDAERKLGTIRRAVITVPAFFEETRRRATTDAGRLAGLEVLDIINEPTAAAIAYGHQLGFLDRSGRAAGDRPLRVLVYDLGGGTFDVTILEIVGTHFKALATDGDVCLGGKDWDARLIDIAAESFKHQFREDPRQNPTSLQELSIAAEAAKRTLTERRKAAIFVNHLGSRLKLEVTREQFEEATAALLERTRMTAELVVRQAGLSWDRIDRVLLVGGSTRMPMVIRMLEELSGKMPERSVSPDEAVAQGAALYAQLLAPRHGEHPADEAKFSLTNVNSHSLGVLSCRVGTGRKVNKVLIPKNSPLPRTVARVFKTARPNQPTVVVKVLEGESERPEACTEIGVCTIRHLPANLPRGWPIRVSYTYAANGQLHVVAKVKGHRAGAAADFERTNSLPREDLELWAHFIEDEWRGRPD